ncbi:hypothetical protein GPECTOR_5g5 [Gonium pectorale]|uniref:Uncharacterized protein n=1 Tax=Gonium pectorale TaxID=33097 RepID=A0A150GXC3_GONPE|nr:hypothetical protein GPECTOR_5g5 [Gonium pectorale]|eukprot:KXZ54393.1 hypothetical protein GPECTOR_5g5 [Gonium pectorale]
MRLLIYGVLFGSILVLLLSLVHLRSSCHNVLPSQVTDLHSLQTLLHEWEIQWGDTPDVASFSRVSDQLAKAIAALNRPQLPPILPPPPASASADVRAAAERVGFKALAVAGTQCHVMHDTDLWAQPVVWGGTHRTANAADCCAACAAHAATAARGGLEHGTNSSACNTWVFCGDEARCGGAFGECWLKHTDKLPPSQRPGAAGSSPWVSGVVYPGDGWLAPYESRTTLTMHFKLGDIVVRLLPELAPRSVVELRRLAALVAGEGGGCGGCRVYRVETAFLVQGVIGHPGAYVATPRHPNPPQKRVMERGLVCWAGGAGGPDWFVNLIDQAGFGDDHLCWGKVDDMALFDAIVARPIKPKAKPNEMTFLAEELRFNITLS